MRSQKQSFFADLLKGIHAQWLEQREKHEAARKEAKSFLTKEHHDREQAYYHGKADGIRQAFELHSDMKPEESPIILECSGLQCMELAPLSKMDIIHNRPFCQKCACEIIAELDHDHEAMRQEEANLR